MNIEQMIHLPGIEALLLKMVTTIIALLQIVNVHYLAKNSKIYFHPELFSVPP